MPEIAEPTIGTPILTIPSVSDSPDELVVPVGCSVVTVDVADVEVPSSVFDAVLPGP